METRIAHVERLLERALEAVVRIEASLSRVEAALEIQQVGVDRMGQHIGVVEGVYRVLRHPLELASSLIAGTTSSLPMLSEGSDQISLTDGRV